MFEFAVISALLVSFFLVSCGAEASKRKKEKQEIERFKQKILSKHLVSKDSSFE